MEKSIFNAIAHFIKHGKKNVGCVKDKYIFYEIIDFDYTNQTCTIKCINTLNYFFSTILQIVLDEDILYFLPPIHACFIGIEYASFVKHSRDAEGKNNRNLKDRKNLLCRYGKYEILYKDRKGHICFKQKNTGDKPLSMDPRDIVLSSDLVQEFDASQAFYIGLEAGLKLDNPIDNQPQDAIPKKSNQRPHLTLIK